MDEGLLGGIAAGVTVGSKQLLALFLLGWGFCCVRMDRTLRLATISVACIGMIAFGSMYASNAQSERRFERAETQAVKDSKQDDRLDDIDHTLHDDHEARMINRTEILTRLDRLETSSTSQSDREFGLSERVGRIEAVGGTICTVIILLEGLGFIQRQRAK